MAYPPPPYADAVCGTHVCGEAICGAWWAYAPSGRQTLGTTNPTVDAISGDVPPPTRLILGGYAPVARTGYVLAVPQAGLRLGGVDPDYTGQVFTQPAILKLKGEPPALKLTQTFAVPSAGLVLGGENPEYVGPILLPPIVCIDLDLGVIACETPALSDGAGIRSISLQAVSAPSLILLQEVPTDPASLAEVP